MTTSKHSPLPWHDDGYGISDSNNGPVTVYGHDSTKEQANRRLIIRAVNSHAALIEVAEEVVGMVALVSGATRGVDEKLRAAIAAAEQMP